MESQYDSCVLVVADRVIARADAGPLDAEFALFDPEGIELRATDPGVVREAGYRVTVMEARKRLEQVGITLRLAEETAAAILPNLAVSYARGPVVRRAVEQLGPAELFEGRVYLSSAKAYEGQWLDLAALTFDFGEPNAARTFQVLHLVSLLHEVPDDAEVYLSTFALTRTQKPGVRTYRRVTFADVESWTDKVLRFADRVPPGSLREGGPTRVEVLDWLHARGERGNEIARGRAQRIEKAIAGTPRPPPPKGPLSDPIAWSIESQIDAGDAAGALNRVAAMERERGSIPCVVYLRSHASLVLKNEDPKVIAERVSMLAANASFDELELLAAQAWAAAGNMGRALPYARVLAGNPRAHQELRVRARRLVEQAESQRPDSVRRTSDSPRAKSSRARGPAGTRISVAGLGTSAPPMSGERTNRETLEAPRRHSPLPAVLEPSRKTEPPPTPRISQPGVKPPTARPFRNYNDQRTVPTEPPPSPVPELDDPTAHPNLAEREERTLTRGISRPAFRAVSTNTTPPQLAIGQVALLEKLEAPASPASLADPRVRAAHEARVRCTALARELGRLYRTQHGIELRTDVRSIEAMQAELLGRYHEAGMRTVAAGADVERHGAALSEIIARTLRATWLDVAEAELGHWTMFIPPDTRIWPFARVLRFVTMGSKERDLVAYFLELHTRSY